MKLSGIYLKRTNLILLGLLDALRQHWKILLIISLPLAGAWTSLLAVQYLNRLSEIHRSQVEGALPVIAGMKRMVEIVPSQTNEPRDEVAQYRQRLSLVSDQIKSTPIKLPSPDAFAAGLAWRKLRGQLKGSDVKTFSGNLKGAAKLHTEMVGVVAYQLAVTDALKKLLEYDAAIDMQGFQAGTPASEEKLRRARGGLEETVNNLRRLRNIYSDSELEPTIAAVQQLQDGLVKLNNNSDTQAWIALCESTQTSILAKRRQFWIEAKQQVYSKVDSVTAGLSVIRDGLKEL